MKLGETIAVLTKDVTGTDEMGEPLYTVHHFTVDNCLVRPIYGAGSEAADVLHRDGCTVRYTIAFPKTYAGLSLRGAKIALIERGYSADDYEHALFVIGVPDVTKPCPTKWNMLVEVGDSLGG